MENVDYTTFSAMQEGKPTKVFVKTTLGKVAIRVLDPFTDKPAETILKGDPRDASCLECYVELWSEKSALYFLRANRKHLETGTLVEHFKEVDKEIKKTVENLSNEEIEELVKRPWKALEATVNKMKTETALQRVIDIAEEVERPEKTMKYLRERLSLVQMGELDGGNDSD